MSAAIEKSVTSHRVARTPGALYSPPRRALKRRRCDGHLTDRHFIEVGETVIWAALPPYSEIGNEHWWHMGFCADCAPELLTPTVALS